MKKLFYSFLLVLVSIGVVSVFGSCKKHPRANTATYPVRIDVQSSFKNDQVQVFMDGKKLLDKTLSTTEVLGVCLPDGQVSTTLAQGNHTIKAVVNGIQATKTYLLNKAVYIGVQYNAAGKTVSFIFSDEPFLYD